MEHPPDVQGVGMSPSMEHVWQNVQMVMRRGEETAEWQNVRMVEEETAPWRGECEWGW